MRTLLRLRQGSFRMLAKIFNTQPSIVYRWIVEAGAKLPDPKVAEGIMAMEFDELGHFVGCKKTSFGSSKPLTVVHGELWSGCLATVILQRFAVSTIK